ncbi:MAG: DUF981 family protein [Nanopusillaceae archaeon]
MLYTTYFLIINKRSFEKEGSIIFIILGLFMLITGLYSLFTWTLPGPYNILFYDLYPIAGLLFLTF